MPMIMTLDGPPQFRQKPPGLLGLTDPFKAHPIWFLVGIVGGIFLAKRKRKGR